MQNPFDLFLIKMQANFSNSLPASFLLACFETTAVQICYGLKHFGLLNGLTTIVTGLHKGKKN